MNNSTLSEIEQVLEQVRPLLARHNGDIEFVAFKQKSGTVLVRLKGTCCGCPLASLTLKSGVEKILRKRVPGVERVESF